MTGVHLQEDEEKKDNTASTDKKENTGTRGDEEKCPSKGKSEEEREKGLLGRQLRDYGKYPWFEGSILSFNPAPKNRLKKLLRNIDSTEWEQVWLLGRMAYERERDTIFNHRA